MIDWVSRSYRAMQWWLKLNHESREYTRIASVEHRPGSLCPVVLVARPIPLMPDNSCQAYSRPNQEKNHLNRDVSIGHATGPKGWYGLAGGPALSKVEGLTPGKRIPKTGEVPMGRQVAWVVPYCAKHRRVLESPCTLLLLLRSRVPPGVAPLGLTRCVDCFPEAKSLRP